MKAVSDNTQPFRVLYVDNDDRRIKSFQRAFPSPIEVIGVADGWSAISYLDDKAPVDLILYNDDLNTRGFMNAYQAKQSRTKIPIILLTDQEKIDLTAAPYHGFVIDAFPQNYSEAALKIRLNYLIQKRDYQRNGRVVHKPVSVRMPIGKRIFDILLSFTILTLISPLLLIVALLVKLDSKGPVFYSSKRVGMGFRIFDMYKFRTMSTGADKLLAGMASQNMYNKVEEKPADELCDECKLANSPCQRPLYLDQKQICELQYHREQKAKAMFSKFKEDPRVTKLGKILRNTSIDELPQLFNILKGDMSFVGNRPLPLYEAEKLTNIGYARRFAAPAGLTGLWQVTKRGKSKVSDLERIQLDVLYAKRHSFRTDLIILLRTLKAVWQKENV
ncbi:MULTISPECIES: sugar transferase [unclassified Spirosoma]|uniref:sugar transferase n=1 Tax=unclassified Spirosoma TaxID=2621999 RepID=UPI0009604416|nr:MULTISPECIES: sugar transferase [unclassified Spirosoma]MBN8821482.1 sugar transferase [Spirosoma sp.]OJW78262.1 MAG: sugar transferase [Spirosoma sp. 48-14]